MLLAHLVERELDMKSIEYLLAKLETIHDDVKELQKHVDELRQESSGRRAVNRFVIGSLGVLGAVVAWVVQQVTEYM